MIHTSKTPEERTGKVTFKIIRKASTNEWIVRRYVDGKGIQSCDYFTDDKADALGTLRHLEIEAARAAHQFALAVYSCVSVLGSCELPATLGTLRGPAVEMLAPGWDRIEGGTDWEEIDRLRMA